MRKISFLIAGTVLLFTLCRCTTVKRFKTADYKGTDKELVDVELFNTQLSAESAGITEKNLWTLSANAQTRMVQILDERYPDNGQFMGVISNNFGSSEVPVQQLIRKDLRMVFSVSKQRDYSRMDDPAGRFSPADRIEYLKLSLEIPDAYGLRFYEWNRYSTEYGEIDLADISFSRNLDLTLDGGPGGFEASSEAKLGRSEKQVLSKRYLKMNGRISDLQLVIEEEGTREVDLTGNVVAEVSLLFDGFPEIVMVPVFAADTGGRVELAALNFKDVLVPSMLEVPDTLYADLNLEYIYRHVSSGWNTFAEWDDKVAYYQGSKSKRVALFLKKDYVPPFFCIGNDQGERNALKFRKSQEREYLLQFRDYFDANRFLEWLQKPSRSSDEPVFIGSSELQYKGEPITPEEVILYGLKVLPVY